MVARTWRIAESRACPRIKLALDAAAIKSKD
jgi:hypothetical protein